MRDFAIKRMDSSEVAAEEEHNFTADDSAGQQYPSRVRDENGLMVKFTYVGLFLFCALYFGRPAEFFVPFAAVPLAKIIGILTLLGLVAVIVFEGIRLRPEAKILLALLGFTFLCVPFSRWPGGSLNMLISGFSKFALMGVAAMTVITTRSRFKKLLTIQTFVLVLFSILALTAGRRDGRMYGVGAMLEDPNDFALNLCVVLPFCLALFLSTRNILLKLFWLASMGALLLAIVSTGSRGGFLALIAAVFVMSRRFGLTGATKVSIALVCLVLLGSSIMFVGPASFMDRMATILHPRQDQTGSAQAREVLLLTSLEMTFKHPIFGIGPGQFENLEGLWHQTHNTYTQLSAEAGIPALILFIWLIRRSFKNLKEAARISTSATNSYLIHAVYCSMISYLTGAFFLSTAFLFLPYILVAYSSGVAQFAGSEQEHQHESGHEDGESLADSYEAQV